MTDVAAVRHDHGRPGIGDSRRNGRGGIVGQLAHQQAVDAGFAAGDRREHPVAQGFQRHLVSGQANGAEQGRACQERIDESVATHRAAGRRLVGDQDHQSGAIGRQFGAEAGTGGGEIRSQSRSNRRNQLHRGPQ